MSAPLDDASRELTAAEAQTILEIAAPMTGHLVGSNGSVLFIGRHHLALSDVVVVVPPEEIIELAAQLSLGALASLRRSAATARVVT